MQERQHDFVDPTEEQYARHFKKQIVSINKGTTSQKKKKKADREEAFALPNVAVTNRGEVTLQRSQPRHRTRNRATNSTQTNSTR